MTEEKFEEKDHDQAHAHGETCACGHHHDHGHAHGEACACGHHHDHGHAHGEACACGHHHDHAHGETCACGHHHDQAHAHGETCACGHHHHDHDHVHADPIDGPVDAFFKKMHEKVAFIELKDGVAPFMEGEDNVPLPIRMQDFLEDQGKKFEDSIPTRALLDGMVWMLAIDQNFPYNPSYRRFLDRAVTDPASYALSLGMDHYQKAFQLHSRRNPQSGEVLREDSSQEEDPDLDQKIDQELQAALLSFRGAYFLDPDNADAGVQYAQLLWSEGDKSQAFFEESSRLLEAVVKRDEKHLLANAALADLNADAGHFIKADSYYQRALAVAEEETIKEELRKRMEAIATETAIENAIYFLHRADYDRALEYLSKAKAQSNRFDVDYYTAVAYQNTGNYVEAVAAFTSSLEKGGDIPDIYNGLIYSLSALGETERALSFAQEGLEKHPEDLSLLFNRAILYSQSQDIKKALEDVESILEYDDISDELFDQTMRLREALLEASH